MRTRRHVLPSVAIILGGSLLVRACEAPTEPTPVAAITVSPSTLALHPTQTGQMTATVLDASGATLTGRSLAWSTSNSAAVTVSATGQVTAVAVGSATITATAEGVIGTSAVSVIPVRVSTVSIDPATANVIVGQTRQLVATPRDSVGAALSGRVVTWVSSDAARATVSETGLVTAVGLGAVTITATSETVSGSAALTVVPVPVDSVAVAPSSATRLVGQTVQFAATTLDSNNNVLTGRVVTWSSSNDAIATVDASGLATALSVGTATITATSEGVGGTALFTVTNVPVASIQVQPDSAARFVGQTAQFTAATYDSSGAALSGRAVTWQTSNAAVATISAAGLATGVAAGTATITATSEGLSDTAFIRVRAVPVDSVSVTPASAVRYPGQSVQLSAATFDSAGGALSGRAVAWTTSDAAVASVDTSGLVTAGAVGTATITATSEGVSGTALIRVDPVPVASVSITPDSAERAVGASAQFSAVARDSAGATLAGRTVTWTSLEPAIATVDASGLATAVAVGLARIVATSEGRADTARFSVTPRVPLVLGPFNLQVTASQEVGQGVATDGVHALYAIQTSNAGSSLAVVRTDSTGNILAGPTSLGSSGDPASVAYGGGTYLVATYRRTMGTSETVAWLVSTDGLTASAAIVVHTDTVDVGGVCGLAYANGTFAVTYMRSVGVNASGTRLSRVFSKTISTAGVVGAELAVSPGYASCGIINGGALASDGNSFLAAWVVQDSATATENGGVQVQARTIATSGALGSVHSIRNTASETRAVSAAARATGGWVVGVAELVNLVTEDFDSYVQPLAADGSPSGSLITIDNSSTIVVARVSEWESGFVVLTIERPGAASTQVAQLRRFDASNAQTGAALLVAEVDGASKPPYALALAGRARIYIAIEYYSPGATFLGFDETSADLRGAWVRP